jgi:hypothetical protein
MNGRRAVGPRFAQQQQQLLMSKASAAAAPVSRN